MSAKRIAAMLMSILLTSGLCGCGNNTVTEFEYDQEETVSQKPGIGVSVKDCLENIY